jgi:photosystem II stability/assembly factor-like uncharacterized protein
MAEEAEAAQVQDFVYSIATSPNFAQDGVCFAARWSGLHRSDDGGSTWRSVYDSLDLEDPLPTTVVAVSPEFEGDQSVFAGTQGGILRSVDGGQSWGVSLLASPPPLVSALVVSPNFAQDGTLLVGTMEDGVFRSADRGSHCYRWNFGLLDLNVLSMAISPGFTDDETLFVGTETGVFRSTNGGRAWREVRFPMDLAPVLSLAPSPNYAEDGVLFAGTESCGLFCSRDRGDTWMRLGEGLIVDPVNDIVLSPEYPVRPDILVMLSRALLVSRDGGQSWSDWRADLSDKLDEGVTSVAAPQGLAPDAPLLVGLVGGDVLRI